MNKRWLAGVTSSQFDICSAYVLSMLATGKVTSMNVKQKATKVCMTYSIICSKRFSKSKHKK